MQIRKILILLLVLALTLGLSMPAFASGYGPGTVGDETPFVPSGDTDNGDDNNNNNTASTARNSATNAREGQYGSPTAVTPAVVRDVAAQAIAAAGTNARVSLVNVSSVNASALRDVFSEAAAAGKSATVSVDAVEAGAVVARVYITEAIAAALSGNIDLSVSVRPAETAATESFFLEHFSNNIAVVSMGHNGAFGADIPLAVQVNLSALNTDTLVFYSYNSATNSYSEIPATNYSVDANGYLHFTTPVGGQIVISDSPLTSK